MQVQGDAIDRAEEPTCAISSVVLMLVALVFKSSTTACVATLMPRRRSMGFMPAATDLLPSDRIALVSTVAVVVPAELRAELVTQSLTFLT